MRSEHFVFHVLNHFSSFHRISSYFRYSFTYNGLMQSEAEHICLSWTRMTKKTPRICIVKASCFDQASENTIFVL